MPIDRPLTERVQRLIGRPGAPEDLASLLVEHSHIPGPRANLELLDVVATAASTHPEQVPVFISWLAIETDNDDPRLFLPVVAAVSLGAIYPVITDGQARDAIAMRLREAANDPRWRVREGVAMGLQRIGEADFSALTSIVRAWITDDASLLEQRAIVAGLAHPPILTDRVAASFALEMGESIATRLSVIEPYRRKTDEFKTLKQGLSYALSVFVAALPEVGFAMLDRLIDTGDRDIVAIVAANLSKNRLRKAHPSDIDRLQARIGHSR